MKYTFLVAVALAAACGPATESSQGTDQQAYAPEYPFRDTTLSVDERVDDLLNRLTVEEKLGMISYESQAVDRLGILPYNWWNEALHGVARNGTATVFPQPIMWGATFDPALASRAADAISTEARAKYNMAQADGRYDIYRGLTFWSPNVNLFRDPRWGRGHETFGEDPVLMSEMGKAFVGGLQGSDPRYLKAAACAKHYVVHSGPEEKRHVFDAVAPKQFFRSYYLKPFEALVKEAGVETVMCAYNRTYGEPCCGSPLLLEDILRREWGFQGHVVSDCGALKDFHKNHKVTDRPEESMQQALQAGVDVNCGDVYAQYGQAAYDEGLISEADLDKAVGRLLRTRIRLGQFDPAGSTPWDQLGKPDVHTPEHVDLAYQVAAKGAVMLKNNGVLPLSDTLNSMAIVGPFSADAGVMLGNYYGITTEVVTFMEGVASKAPDKTNVTWRLGQLAHQMNEPGPNYAKGFAREKDAVVYVAGLSIEDEGEEGETIAQTTAGDRVDIAFPKEYTAFLKEMREQGDNPIILVLTGGSAQGLEEVIDLVDAVIVMWYPGEQGGNALADILWGNVNPSGKLPVTFPKNTAQLPDYEDYDMRGRTYLYMEEEPMFPFGFGLSYTTFAVGTAQLSTAVLEQEGAVTVTATVTNEGDVAGEEVVQLYARQPSENHLTPGQRLLAFQRISLESGASGEVSFEVPAEDLLIYNADGEQVWEPGQVDLVVATAAPIQRSADLGAAAPAVATLTLQ